MGLKYRDCLNCRRANSHLCAVCQNASLFLINDTRKFYYINDTRVHYQGPVEAYLLPYVDVFVDSYLWTVGMTKWDFAGNILDGRTFRVNTRFCPKCNGTFVVHTQNENSDDPLHIYKCTRCGFVFRQGGIWMTSNAQRDYCIKYFHDSTLQAGHRILFNSCLTNVRSSAIVVDGVKSWNPSCIIYKARRFYDGVPGGGEKIELAELFLMGIDGRDENGVRIINKTSSQRDGNTTHFFDFIRESLPSDYPMRQIMENFGDEYGLNQDFIKANNTLYFARPDSLPDPQD